MRKSTAALASFTLAVALHGFALAAPASPASVEALLELTRTEATMEASYEAMAPMMQAMTAEMLKGKTLSPEQQRFAEAFPARLTALMREEFNWATLKPDFVKLYADVFDQAEIDAMVAFYRSPAGQSMLDKMPQVVQRSMQLSQARMVAMMPKLQRAAHDAMRDAGIQP